MNKMDTQIRYQNFDIAKALAILFMIMVHCLETFGTEQVLGESVYGMITEFFGSFTSATVFMILLGMGIHFTKNSSPKRFITRGLLLIGAGYLLNVLRGTLPMFVTLQITGDAEWVPYMVMELFWIDILQFAGLAFLYFGIMKWIGATTRGYLISLVVFQIVNYVLLMNTGYYENIMNYREPGYYLSAFTGLFWGSGEFSSFPFLTWIFYPVMGYLFGTYFLSLPAERRTGLYGRGLIGATVIGCVTFFTTWYFEIDFGWETDASFYHHWLPGNLIFGSCAFALIFMVSLGYQWIPKIIEKVMVRWSKNVTVIYFIQWVLIGWIAVFAGYNTMNLIQTVMVTISVLIASDALAFGWKKMRKQLPKY